MKKELLWSFVVVIIFLAVTWYVSKNMPLPEVKESAQTTQNITGPDGSILKITDTIVGEGDEAVAGKTLSMNYVGTLLDGTKFDSSYDRNEPFSFVLGGGQVIKGWDQGIVGMKVGGKRHLEIPSSFGYGDTGYGPIPAKATLIFDVELLEVK